MTTALTPLLSKDSDLTTIYDARSEQYRHNTGSIATSELKVSGLSVVSTSLASPAWFRAYPSTPVGLARIFLIVMDILVWIDRLSRRFRSHLGALLLALLPTRPTPSGGTRATSYHFGQHPSDNYHNQTPSQAAQDQTSDRLRNSALKVQLHSQARAIDSLESDCRQTSIHLSTALQQEQAMAIALQEARAENERHRDEAARYEHLWRMEVQQHAESKRQSITGIAASRHSRSTSLSIALEARKGQGLGLAMGVGSIAYPAPLGARPMPQRRESMPLASKRMSGRFKYLTLHTAVDEDAEVAAAPRTV